MSIVILCYHYEINEIIILSILNLDYYIVDALTNRSFMLFMLFADIYSHFIAPMLQQTLLVQSWMAKLEDDYWVL